MRLAHVSYADAFVLDGVARKLQSQAHLWRQAGHEVELFMASRPPADPSAPPALDANVFRFDGPGERIAATVAVASAIRRFGPDLVYLRDWFVPPLPPLLWPLPVVLEINTDDRAEARLYGRANSAYNEVHRLGTFPFASGFVCVTHELRRTLGPSKAPVAVIANGAEASVAGNGAPNAKPHASGTRAVMLVGARPAPLWNGIDKLPSLLDGFPGLVIDLIGPGEGNGNGLPRLPENVEVHGMLTREQYTPLLERADFALGPLALHRKDMVEACPLKVREYLVNGLPVVVPYDDTDFLGTSPWFILQLPNTEDNIATHAEAVGAWAAGLGGRRVPRESVLGRISADAKERARIAFFEHVLSRRSKGAGGRILRARG